MLKVNLFDIKISEKFLQQGKCKSLVINKIKIVKTFDVLNLLATYHDNFSFHQSKEMYTRQENIELLTL